MKMIDYQKLMSEHKPVGHISVDANTVSNALIRDNCIQAGNSLARFLDVDTCFNDHMAIRVWVQRRLDAQDKYIMDEMCGQLQGELYEIFSTLSYGL